MRACPIALAVLGCCALERVTHLFSHESPAVFVEIEGGKLEVLTKFDLMDTIAGLVGQKR
jgi:hypothetical protein